VKTGCSSLSQTVAYMACSACCKWDRMAVFLISWEAVVFAALPVGRGSCLKSTYIAALAAQWEKQDDLKDMAFSFSMECGSMQRLLY